MQRVSRSGLVESLEPSTSMVLDYKRHLAQLGSTRVYQIPRVYRLQRRFHAKFAESLGLKW